VRASALVAAVMLVAAAACGANERDVTLDAPRGGESPAPTAPPTSIVQLGDSIASGEGTLYGYTYDTSSQEWTGGNIDAPWPPPYPLCHDSPDAYGNVVARNFDATFTQFACTGATFAEGISAPETSDGTQMRPAQFGNWDTQQDLNAEYDAARPDVVLVTLGADDLQFVAIVEACIKNGYEHYFDSSVKLQCTEANPGSTIEQDFFDFLPTLEENYGTLVTWIEKRAQANNVPVPKIVFTNYANPLPPSGTKCPDTSWLYKKQTQYLSSLVGELNQKIEAAIEGLDNPDVALADISGAYSPAGSSHIWCTDDPWAYGLSIYHMYDPDSFDSQAPFHPTPDGQNSIAEHVIPVVSKLHDLPPSGSTTTTSTTTSTSTTSTSSTTTTAPPSTSSSTTTSAATTTT
jgi:lysophospholipase L1-like esterase